MCYKARIHKKQARNGGYISPPIFLLVSFLKSPFHCRFLILTIPLALVAVVVVDADEGTGEGEHLAKGGKYAGVDDASGRYAEGDEDEKHAHAHNRKCQEHLVAGLRLSGVSFWESRHSYACSSTP